MRSIPQGNPDGCVLCGAALCTPNFCSLHACHEGLFEDLPPKPKKPPELLPDERRKRKLERDRTRYWANREIERKRWHDYYVNVLRKRRGITEKYKPMQICKRRAKGLLGLEKKKAILLPPLACLNTVCTAAEINPISGRGVRA